MTEEIRIRRAAPADAAPLAELAARTFFEAFSDGTPPDDMAAHLATSYGPRQQSEEIADPGVVTLLAESGGALAGYAQVRRHPAPECVRGEAPIEIRRFYVDRPWHGSGLARVLMDATLEAARGLGGRTAWLGVWENNGRAIAFYRKHGFVDVGQQEFRLGTDCQTDRVMMAPLGPPQEIYL